MSRKEGEMKKKKQSVKIYKNAIVARSINRRVVIYQNEKVEGAFQMEITSCQKGFESDKDIFCKSVFKRKGVMVGVISMHEITMRMMITVMTEVLNNKIQPSITPTQP